MPASDIFCPNLLMDIINKRVPNIEPCGTPLWTLTNSKQTIRLYTAACHSAFSNLKEVYLIIDINKQEIQNFLTRREFDIGLYLAEAAGSPPFKVVTQSNMNNGS